MNNSIVLMVIKNQLTIQKKELFFNKLKNDHPNAEKIERTTEFNEKFN